jgi:hypothetical protein
MHRLLNIFFILLILLFFFSAYKYYSSNKNLKLKDFNRNNINQIINNKISELPLLSNDTNNVIFFNNSISSQTENDKPRSFWKLFKSK